MTTSQLILQLEVENAELRLRLEEAEQALRSIREGEVDSVVVGDRVFALAEAENLNRRMLEAMNVAGLAVTPDGLIVYSNAQAQAVLGQSDSRLVGVSLFSMVTRADEGALRDILQRASAEMLEARIEFVDAGGDTVPTQVWVSGLRSQALPLVCLLVADLRRMVEYQAVLSRMRESQAALEVSEQRMQLALQVSRAFAFEWSAHDDRIVRSSSCRDILDVPVHDDLSRFLDGMAPLDRERYLLTVERLAPTNPGYSIQYRFQRSDGSIVDVDEAGCANFGADGSLVRVLGVARDVTRQRDIEARLVQAQKLEAVGLLAGGIAHDFNNLMMVVLMCGELLLEQLPAEGTARDHVQDIVAAGERATALVRHLLAFSRRQHVQPRVIEVDALVRKVEPAVRRLLGDDIHLGVQIAADLPAVFVDPDQMEQVVIHIAHNARDVLGDAGRFVIEADEVEVSGGFDDDLLAGRYVALRFKDNGCGMPEDVVERVFEPYFTTKEVGQGSGLGLSAVYGILKQAGGSVSLASTHGKGTTVTVYLPSFSHKHRHGFKDETLEPSVGGDREGVLLVEESSDGPSELRQVLESLDYEVRCASSPTEAIRMVDEGEFVPDVLLTDVLMPELNGVALAHRLRSKIPGLRVLFIADHPHGGFEEVFDSPPRLLTRPFDKGVLSSRLRQVLGRPSAEPVRARPQR